MTAALDLVPARIAERLKPDGDCLVYMGSRDEKGYGRVYFEGRNRQLVHRIVWRSINGPIPALMVICHGCDNPPCARPEHLFIGTKGDNNRDREAKGRSAISNLDAGRAAVRAKARALTHCPQGHPYDVHNLRRRPSGARRCAECYRQRSSQYAHNNRDRINARRRALRAERSSS